jgi:multiple sugar transport system permease protein
VNGVVPQQATLANFGVLGGSSSVPVWRWMLNSLIVSSSAAGIAMIVDSLAAYGLARIGFRGSKVVFGAIVISLAIPFVATLVPLYLEFSSLNLLNSYEALILPFAGNGFGVFLLYQFFRKLPVEVEEAAKIDGAGQIRIWWGIAVPMAGPAIVTLGVITFMNAYNDFFWPLVAISSNNMRTLTVGIAITAIGQFSTNYGELMALTAVSVVPMVIAFLIAQRRLVEGAAGVGTVG